MRLPCVSHPPVPSTSLEHVFPSSNIIQSFISHILTDDPFNLCYNFGNTYKTSIAI